ncbi:MAG: MBOAT family O-acyltransferase [Planctomycetota bacterium]
MIFTEARFFVFFFTILAVYWGLRGDRSRKAWLLLASYAFYAAWRWEFLSLILTSTVVDWIAGARLQRATSARARKGWLALSLGVNLTLLGFFKYFGWFVDSGVEFLNWLGLGASAPVLSIVLPVGISFYTFQTLSYTIDIYRRELEPTDSRLDFALFVAFFPQLVAGPIVRAVEFLPQLGESKRMAAIRWRPLLLLFLFGYVKKACLSDNLSVVIDPVFADPLAYDRLANATASVLYHLQIYCDFSGYSDMAIATAGMLGYTLPLNFDFPYLAANMAQFWRRWHVSLSTWFRDYVYLPLGGSRVTTERYVRNVLITFVVSGLWHGAQWTFVLWGFLHALGLLGVWGWGKLLGTGPLRRAVGHVAWIPTTLFVVLTWIVFRAVDFDRLLAMWGVLGGWQAAGSASLATGWWGIVAGFYLVHTAMARGFVQRLLGRLSEPAFALVLGILVALVLPFASSGYQPFLYFQF